MTGEEIDNIKKSIDKWRTIRRELITKINQQWVMDYWVEGSCGYCDQYIDCEKCPLFSLVGPMVVCYSAQSIHVSHAYSALSKADDRNYAGALKSCAIVLDFMEAHLRGYIENKPDVKQEYFYHYRVLVCKDIPIGGVVPAYNVQWLIDEMMEEGVDLGYENFVKGMRERGFTEEKIERESEDFEGGTYLLGFIKNDDGLYEPDPEADISAIWNKQHVQIVRSETIKRRALCSPCFPGQGDLDTPGDYLTYCVPEEYYDYEEGEGGMKVRYLTHRSGKWTFKAKEWSCCGYTWQLLLSRRYPDRYNWNPVCPNCKSTINKEV